ncbi:hypothetical protein Vadar_027990 [Vaccinium darrowii]|uniref:Uncharacterized protein n=1 Tax=Vaccinium darrowii TaxID=229202 RepID=A0ACB7YQP6_9ERIC|nr:hypothetical protein Vadar_027990 [Vaccinium darrowii]
MVVVVVVVAVAVVVVEEDELKLMLSGFDSGLDCNQWGGKSGRGDAAVGSNRGGGDLEEGTGDLGVNSSVCLLGKVMHGKSVKASALDNILKVAWRIRAPFHVDDWNNNIFLFCFEEEEDRLTIL